MVSTNDVAEEELTEMDKQKIEEALYESPLTSPKPEKSADFVKGSLKKKVKFISKMLIMQKVLRENHEKILKIKAQTNALLPQGLLMEGKDAVAGFLKALQEDSVNERRPD